MPALDYYHEQIVHALENDGWTVQTEIRLRAGRRAVYIDALASRLTNGSRQQILLAEIKCFPDRDRTTRDLYMAIGQYVVYQSVLDEREIVTSLYLVIPESVYQSSVFDHVVQRALRDHHIRVIIVNLVTERVVQWITP